MAKVALRLYNREIEGLIDQGGTNEAIAHCRHILKTFPKYLETYRLLGKSYLESHRYNEAIDVFSRVLMATPDDFVAHVGMSIINDEQNRLDDSIWHMERAFESQPSNAAIQGELQRLYGRRDGMEPPKVRMTRGALAHMYVQGELYPQAIAEIRAVLGQDAGRSDMQILLARAFYKSGQKADAADLCTKLLSGYAYCFDANRIMVELLPSSVGAAESTQVYRTRVNELEPYAAFARGSVFLANEVTDNSVSIDRLDYAGEDLATGAEWNASLGLGATAAPALTSGAAGDQPDWLKEFSPSQPNKQPVVDPFGQAPAAAAPAAQPPNEIPDFLRAAGWGESSGGAEQPPAFVDADPGAGDLAPANIPDWLKGQVPAAPAASPSMAEPAQRVESPDWLSTLGNSGPAPSAPAESSNAPDWLSGLGSAQPAEAAPAENNSAPDWLSGLGASASQKQSEPVAESSPVPDWLHGLGGAQFNESAQEPAADSPSWLNQSAGAQESAPAPQESADVPDWLGTLGHQQPAESSEAASLPDWLSAPPAESQQPIALGSLKTGPLETPAAMPAAPMPTPASIDSLGASAQEQDDAVAWLESLAAKHGAKPEELVTDPTKRSETPPDWVAQARAAAESPNPIQTKPLTPIKDLGASAQEQDDAVAWLESLAAKHGAKPEELVTDPNKRSETPPDWVQQVRSAAAAEPAKEEDWSKSAQDVGEKFFSDFEDGAAPEPGADDATGMWLRDKQAKEDRGRTAELPRVELPQAELPHADLPAWMNEASDSPLGSDAPAPKTDVPDWLSGLGDDSSAQEFGVQNISRGDLSDWLSGLDEAPAQEAAPAAAEATPADLPDWLQGADPTARTADAAPAPASAQTEEPAPASMDSDLPGWLQGMDAQSAGDEDAPWLKKDPQESSAEPQLKRTVPSDWQPAEPKQAAPRKADFASRVPKPAPKPSAAAPSDEPVYEPIEKEMDWSNEPAASAEPRKPIAPAPMSRPAAMQPVMQAPAAVPAKTVVQKAPAVKKQVRVAETVPGTSALSQAKDELDRGDIPAALEHYSKLIKKGKHLEETIHDLSDSIYRYPVEVSIWQTLGDAYMRANRLKEALEAYNKAEELIR